MDPIRLGKYEIVAKIGHGAMGDVYRAHDPVLGRDVAIKTMNAHGGADDELRKRFHREAQSAARLNHSNIVTVYDFGEEQGRLYMAMELLEGTDLKDLIARRAPLGLDQKLDIMEQICDGLSFAHEKEVVHRDLKPANIHVLPSHKVKIMDFGLARLQSSDMTRAGMIMGTPHYMSPEQVRGERATSRSDVFSLGAVFYELLSYRRPFEGESMQGVWYNVVNTEPPPLADLVAAMPAPVAAVVARAMAKDPALRFAHAGHLRDALRGARATAPPQIASVPPRPLALPDTVLTPARVGPPGGRSQAAVALEPDRTRVAVPPPTLSGSAPTMRPASPAPAAWPPPVAEAPAGVGPQRRLVLAGGGVAVVVGIAIAAWQLRPGDTSGPPDTLVSSPVPATLPAASPPVMPPPGLSPLERTRRLLQEHDYRGALAEAEAGLRVSSGDVDLQRLRTEAEAAVRRGEAAARQVRAALDARDGPGAAAALARLLEVDPRGPQVPALTQGVKQVLAGVGGRPPAPTLKPPVTVATGPLATSPPVTVPPATSPPVTTPPTTVRPPPSTAGPPTPSAAELEAGNRQAIRGVLNEYREAFEALNVDALRTIHPSVDYAAMKSAFTSVTGYTVKVQIRDIRLQGAEAAVADCLVTYSPIPKPSGKPKPVPTIFHLKKVGTVWRIDRVQRN